MTELKAKVTLKTKGEEAYVSIKQLLVTLKWTAAVDLDLMAFYKAKDGRVGGVFSDNYIGGSMGSLNSFPFIQLSGDAGVGARGGENEETLRIIKLDEMAEVYVCALNFSDAAKNRNVSFYNYDGHVLVVDDKGESIAVPLNSRESGTVAVIARIDNSGFMGAKLINENRVLDMTAFQQTIPGANLLKISSKSPEEIKADNRFVELKKKATLAVKRMGLEGQQAKVALALDVSGSMGGLFRNGIVQRACERLLALGVKFDDNGAIDIFLFDDKDYEVGELHESKFYGYVDREILGKYKNIWSGTCYAGVMKRIIKKYSPDTGLLGGFLGKKTGGNDPAYVIFVTDGDNSDKSDAEKIIIDASKKPIFWQFVGIGNSSFTFLEKLDTMSGRFIDNANFFKLNDIDSISDEDLYERLLSEFPSWLKLAKQKGLY